MTIAKQIIVLEITVDIDRFPLPAFWDWDELAVQLSGAASVNVLATGEPVFERPLHQPARGGTTLDVCISPDDPNNEARN